MDPKTAQVHAVSDPIPHVFGGVLLDVRSIAVKIDRRQFSLNPTNCAPMAVGGTLRGGGGRPERPRRVHRQAGLRAVPGRAAARTSASEPKLHLRLFGGMRRARNPKLRAVLIAREGDANIGRAAVTLPRTLFLDQASLAKVCTRPQYAAGDCPKESIYGFARALHPAARRPARRAPSTCAPPTTCCRTSSPPCAARSNIELAGRIDTVQGQDPQHLRRRPRRAGLQVHPHHEGRQRRAAGQLGQPVQKADPRHRQVQRRRTARRRTSGRSCARLQEAARAREEGRGSRRR